MLLHDVADLHCGQASVEVRPVSAQVGYDCPGSCLLIACGLHHIQAVLQGRQLTCRRRNVTCRWWVM